VVYLNLHTYLCAEGGETPLLLLIPSGESTPSS